MPSWRSRSIATVVAVAASSCSASVKALDSRELLAVLHELPEGWRLFFEFLAETGLRIGEAIEVRWRDFENLDVEVGARWLRVQRRYYRGRVARPKGRKTRRLRLTPELALVLRQLRDERRAGDEDLVFVADKGGRISTSNLARRVLKPAAVRAGFGRFVDGHAETWVSFHVFRHSCATRLIRDDAWSLEHVQEYLGHSSYEITRRFYVHLLPEDQPEQRSIRARQGDNRVTTRPAEIGRERPAAGASG
jgi:integrase